MKRMMGVGLVAMLLAVTGQAQNTGLTAAGSNFTGPGGGGGGATATVGAFLPTFTGGVSIARGGQSLASARFVGATAPANVTLGSGANAITVSVPASAQQAVANALSA